MTRISVIIPTFNRGDIFKECLNSVISSISKEDELIIVNDSKKHSLQLTFEDPRIQVFDNPKSGVASARNLGAHHSNGQYLLFIDDDMIINKEAVESCYRIIKELPNYVINADWVYNPNDLIEIKKTSFGRYLDAIEFTSLKGWCTNLTWKRNDVIQANGLTSQFMLIRKSLFLEVNGYNEQFPFAGFEDYDLGKRLEEVGIQFLINTQCLVYHNEKDRMDVLPFLERKRRGAYTRRKAVELGYPELIIEYSSLQRGYYQILCVLRPIILLISNSIPNNPKWDKMYRKMLNRLIGIYIFSGYNERN